MVEGSPFTHPPLSSPLGLSGLQEVYPHKNLRQHLPHSCFSAFSSSNHPRGDHLGCLLRSSTLSWTSVYSPIAWTTQGSGPTCIFPCAWHRHSNVSRPLQSGQSRPTTPWGSHKSSPASGSQGCLAVSSAWSPAPFLLLTGPGPAVTLQMTSEPVVWECLSVTEVMLGRSPEPPVNNVPVRGRVPAAWLSCI